MIVLVRECVYTVIIVRIIYFILAVIRRKLATTVENVGQYFYAR